MRKLSLTLLFIFCCCKSSSFQVIEDGFLSFTELATKYGYPSEEHFVTTHDGYILRLHRIPQKKSSKIVFIMHGLLLSSVNWIFTGPNKSLGYLLANEGYDVWIGNARGNHESRNHTTLNPDKDPQFWNFTFHEIGVTDVPAMIDYILAKTNQQQLYHIGHSQGATTFYVMTSMRPEYNEKVRAHFSLAPVVFVKHMRKGLLWAAFHRPVTFLEELFGYIEVLPQLPITKKISAKLCHDGSPFQFLCSGVLNLIFGHSLHQMNATLLPTFYAHFPAGASVFQFEHYGQLISSGEFSQFDYGKCRNLKVYNSIEPPNYDLQKITTPINLFYSLNDYFTSEIDVSRLCNHLGSTCKAKYLIEDHQFNHLDFVFGSHAAEFVYRKLIYLLAKF